ncbi:biotin--[acetyl-CoA-carboxylase] ligase [candidate division WOR-1 bacterium RIFOXYA12_FULL_52_29]|uniref:Biotin--[acetyl-CoA-carboxylase] ligase n=1 Tax=candidate division WOR-1 bacterium RIFOXYC12_FULL_54_18 TaxID=1802584 RepID=A0A1F4T499_UNCSA|nr:MAG: biotin--[acetyl-CoA-carboxylase] ligase [candidate division WOR-1 bacterium RIFOXYA2_FULL_51_19]OGC17003.1 MAG: biotin--[acetyl-CoA-carboxylase] ligase [candidate division WOR-1 bacterium RIFOXYA12_FULL_52_29]OGC25864.1 MAG: biotin--[acetyl-CoA-carboxylase] ligase [candidate division WOR-1 bacterium RIFOXYB2_FULL_45_9]OGC27420.1 MAG: biotin--[acetyl-CoA-carboxylase] ligase [candidate division WOR-1 bacterium RIFOXYC12_FULL_54_18]OGC29367.1 MAG: biotin--[acetyl-CoA-carboxylase] ligase [c
MIIGRKIVHYPEIDSTSDEARRLVKLGEREGLVIVADRQTGGRGKPGSGWFSPEGNLYFSTLLKPYRNPPALAPITLFSALAARSALSRLVDLPIMIKWPNDLLVRGRKIAGVLVEGMGGYLIVGIGINVNMSEETLPMELRGKATSLIMETGTSHDLKRLSRLLIKELNDYYSMFLGGDK